MQGEALFREHGEQVAALCWRASSQGKAAPDVLLVTSRSSRRWILPKGWLKSGLTPAENAAREAFEEAGVIGKMSDRSVGIYHYLKDRKDGGGMPCRVEVFALAVTREFDDWPEKNARERTWLPLDQAMVCVAEPGVRQLLKNFRKQLAPAKVRRTG